MVLKFIHLWCISQHTIRGYSIHFIEFTEQVLAQVNYMKSNGWSNVNCTCTEFKHVQYVWFHRRKNNKISSNTNTIRKYISI